MFACEDTEVSILEGRMAGVGWGVSICKVLIRVLHSAPQCSTVLHLNFLSPFAVP